MWQTIVQNGIHPIGKTGASNARLQLVPGCTCRSLGNVHDAAPLLRTAQHPHGGRPPVRRYMEGFASQGQHHLPMIACPLFLPSFSCGYLLFIYLITSRSVYAFYKSRFKTNKSFDYEFLRYTYLYFYFFFLGSYPFYKEEGHLYFRQYLLLFSLLFGCNGGRVGGG